jgi:hypothetical protein
VTKVADPLACKLACDNESKHMAIDSSVVELGYNSEMFRELLLNISPATLVTLPNRLTQQIDPVAS